MQSRCVLNRFSALARNCSVDPWQYWWRWKVEQAATISGPLWKLQKLPAKQVHYGSFTRGKYIYIEIYIYTVGAFVYMCARGFVLSCFVYIVCFSRGRYRGDQCQGCFISFNATPASAELAEDTGLRADGSCQESTGDQQAQWRHSGSVPRSESK